MLSAFMKNIGFILIQLQVERISLKGVRSEAFLKCENYSIVTDIPQSASCGMFGATSLLAGS